MILTSGETIGASFSLTVLAGAAILWFLVPSSSWAIFLIIGGIGLMMTGLHILKHPDQQVSNRKPEAKD